MRSILTAVIAAIEAVAVALAGLLVVAVPAALLWVITFRMEAEPAEVVAGTFAAWLLGHFVPLTFELSPEAAVGLGLAPEALAFTLSLAPLGLTLLTLLLGARSGSRFGRRGGTGAAGVLGGALGFAGATALVAPFAGDLTAWPFWSVVAVPALVYGLASGSAFLLAAAREGHPWWTASRRGLQRGMERARLPGAAAFPARVAEALRLALAALAALVGVSAVAVAVALVLGYADITALTQQLQLDPLGSTLLFLLHAAMFPVALIWGIAWLSGAGFAVGVGSSASPFGALLGPLPALPLFGAIPQGWGGFGALAPAILVFAGLCVGVLFARRPQLRRATWPVALAVTLAAGLLLSLAVAALCALASGSIGPERLAETGARPWIVGGLVAAELGGGLLLGVCAGRVDYSRLRETLPEALAGIDAVRRLRRGSGERPGGADDEQRLDEQETVELTEVAAGVRGEHADAATPRGAADPDRGADPDRRAGPDRETEPGADSDPDRETDPGTDPESESDALARAYSWDGRLDDEAEPVSRPRSGWRFPRRGR